MESFSSDEEEFKSNNELKISNPLDANLSSEVKAMENVLAPEGQYEEETIAVSVVNPVIIEERLRSHVSYTVMGQDSKGTFEVPRRYKDFQALRESLVSRWPGCFIPQIPPKQAMVTLI